MKCKKALYKDKIEAMFTLSQLRFKGRKGNPNRREKRVYYCAKCNGWHITSKISIPKPHACKKIEE